MRLRAYWEAACACSSARLRSDTSRAIDDAPMILPPPSMIGDTVSETLTLLPSFLTRIVS